MKKDDIEKELRSLADDLNNETIKKQRSVNNNYYIIDKIKKTGVGDVLICDILNSLLNTKLEYSYFRSLLSKARKRASKSLNEQKNVTIEKVMASNESSKKNHIKQAATAVISAIDEITVADYMKVCFGSERIAKRAIEAGVSIEEIKSWKCPNQINLGTRLTNYIQTK